MVQPEPILAITNLSVSYGEITALFSIDLHVPTGRIIALLGANGSGKSTLLETVVGVHRASTGTVYFEGSEITNLASEQIVRRGIAIVPEGRGVFPSMSVRDNLLLGADVSSLRHTALEPIYDQFPILAERTNQPAGTLSGGERRMLVIGRTLMSDPRLILLDEPSIGLAPKTVETVFLIVQSLSDSGYTILLAEQNAHQALSIAHHGYVFDRGRVVHDGPAPQLRGDPRVAEAYLGAQL